jgi:SAM-dependent methyltransferase
MDLREHKHYSMRHPWEIARVRALKLLLNHILTKELTMLDIGCGDGYVCSELIQDSKIKHITALDIHLSDEQITALSARGGNVRYVNDYEAISATRYDLILLLDVLEHISDDRGLLREITEKNLATGGFVVITAPMFPALFTPHDAFLGHYRRYSLSELAGLADAGGLQSISSGYFFSSLLCVRYFQKLLKRPPAANQGVGNWNHGSFVTRILASLLTVDAGLSLLMNRMNINLPGLTGWVLCKKQRS